MAIATFDPAHIEPTPLGGMIHVTDAAARHLAAQLQSQHKSFLRLGVKESGCNGYSYYLDYLDTPGTDDVAVPVNEHLSVYVATNDLALVRGTHVDYVRDGLNATLQFKNANATGYCGCGESFSLSS
jgi:Fe-S cluster assembly protein SufA